MKKIIILLIISLTTTFCAKKQEDLVKEKVIQSVKERLKNPDSFEFVSYEVFKTEKYKDAKKTIPILKELISLTNGEEKREYQKEYDFINTLTDKNNNDIVYYYTYLTAKGTNSFNAIIQSKYFVKVLNNKELEVVVLKEK